MDRGIGTRLTRGGQRAEPVPVRVIVSEDAVAFVRDRGGRLFVWAIPLDAPTGGAAVFALEASTDSPGADREFARFAGEGFDVLIDVSEHGAPDELHLAVKGWYRKRIRAYWNGHSFGRD
jgi:hypothetical protein